VITADELHTLYLTWNFATGPRPADVPEAAYRLWISANALVNRLIPIEQAAYLHAEENLGRGASWDVLAEEYDRTLSALQQIKDEPKFLHHLWLALHGWGHYDPTPEAREANRKMGIDHYQKESLLTRVARAWMLERMKSNARPPA